LHHVAWGGWRWGSIGTLCKSRWLAEGHCYCGEEGLFYLRSFSTFHCALYFTWWCKI